MRSEDINKISYFLYFIVVILCRYFHMQIIFHVDCVFYDRNKSNTSHTTGKSESGLEDDFEPAGFCSMDSKSCDTSTWEAVWDARHMTSSGIAAGCDDVGFDDIISDFKFPIPMEELRPYLDSFEDVLFDDVLT